MLEFFPLMYLSFRCLKKERKVFRKDCLLLIPGILIGCSILALYIVMGDEEATAYIREVVLTNGNVQIYTDQLHRIHYILNNYIYIIAILIQIVFILMFSIIYYIRYYKRLNILFEKSEDKSMTHNKVVSTILFVCVTVSLIIIARGGLLYYTSSSFSVPLWMGAWTVVLYSMGYYITLQKYKTVSVSNDYMDSDEEYNSLISPSIRPELPAAGREEEGQNRNYAKLLPEFNKIMEEDKVFLQSNLRLDDVAHLVNTNRTYISYLLKEEYQCGFSEYINRKRIEYAQELAHLNSTLSQEQIAEKSGFAHSSSFCRTFKKYTGMTFREWQKTIQN